MNDDILKLARLQCNLWLFAPRRALVNEPRVFLSIT
jgi:hypothetical protein